MFQWSGPHGGDRPCAKRRRNGAVQTGRLAVETMSLELWPQTQLHVDHDLNHSRHSRGDCHEKGQKAGRQAQSPQCGQLRCRHFARLVSNDLDHAQNIDPDDLARRSLKSKGIRSQFAALRVMGCLGQGFRSENTKWDASTIGKMPQEPLLAFILCRSAPPAAHQNCCHPPYCGKS